MPLQFLVRLVWLIFVMWSIDSGQAAANKRAQKCIQPPQSGRCFGYVPSFAYNPIERKCEDFIYGGCGGNDNRFNSKRECEQACRSI